jgi:hypothetical protein
MYRDSEPKKGSHAPELLGSSDSFQPFTAEPSPPNADPSQTVAAPHGVLMPPPATTEPASISANRRHSSDPNRRRATFGVEYPDPARELTLEGSADVSEKLPRPFENGRRTVTGARIFFAVPDIIVLQSDFAQCKFHRRSPERGESRIVGATFVDCTFEKCIFGGTAYKHVHFESCTHGPVPGLPVPVMHVYGMHRRTPIILGNGDQPNGIPGRCRGPALQLRLLV